MTKEQEHFSFSEPVHYLVYREDSPKYPPFIGWIRLDGNYTIHQAMEDWLVKGITCEILEVGVVKDSWVAEGRSDRWALRLDIFVDGDHRQRVMKGASND